MYIFAKYVLSNRHNTMRTNLLTWVTTTATLWLTFCHHHTTPSWEREKGKKKGGPTVAHALVEQIASNRLIQSRGGKLSDGAKGVIK